MPPRKTPAKRKKPPPATTPTPVDDRKSPKQEVETVAELPNVSKVETEEISGQVEVSDPILAKIEGDSTTAVAFSPKLVIEADVVVDHSAVGDVNEARNEDVCVEDEEPEEEEEPEEDEQPSGIDGSQLETVAAVKGDNEEEKQEHAEIIAAEEPNADKAPCNNDATTKTSSEDYIALLIEHDNEESDDGSEGDDADNEDPSDNPVSDHNKEKDIEIYVGGLDKNTVEDDLVNVFQQFGELKSTRIVRNSTTNKSKGFAFIRFVSPDHAKHALSELKDGVEVRGKILKISQSQDNHTLYLGNISKTWKQEEVNQQLKQYGIEHIDMIRLPENPKIEGKNKGFAFLEFNSHSDAVTAYQRLKKPDAVFGRDISAKVAFAQTPVLQNDEDLLHATRVYLEGLTKDWNEEKVKEVCKKYGEIVKVDICQNTRNKNKDFGFVSFASNESALACVEGINNADFGEVKIKAEIAKSRPKKKSQKQIFSGGFKVEPSTTSNKKGGNVTKETSEPKSTKMKAQTKSNKKDITKNKSKVAIKNGETSKKTEILKIKGDSNPQQSNKKRKTPSKQNLNPPPRHSDTKKPKFGSEGQNSNSASKPGTHKRKGREEEGSKNRNRNSNRNTHDKKPFKKQKGSNMHGRERDNNNYRSNPNSNIDINGVRRGQLYDDYRVTSNNRYMDSLSYPPTSYLASDSYRLPPDSLSTRRFKEMEPHAGYIGPTSTTHTRSYSSYVPTVVRTHNPHQTVYLSPGQSQLHSRYSDRTQSHRGGYSETSIVPEVQSYRTYRDPYDSGISRSGGHDGRGGGVVTYVGGPSIPSSQVRSHTSYYQGGGSYSGDYTSQRTYY